jgi:hypothetical protein
MRDIATRYMRATHCYREDLFKVVLAGGPRVGKTAILKRLSENAFQETYVQSIFVDFTAYSLTLDTVPVKLQVVRDVFFRFCFHSVSLTVKVGYTRRRT